MVQIAGRRVAIDWGHLAVATLVLLWCLWYLYDARSASLKISNLILIQPGVIIACILYLLILPQCFRVQAGGREAVPGAASDSSPQTAADALSLADFLRIGSLVGAFGVFIYGLEAIGFDVSAFLFILVGLFICGERRWWVLAVFPPVFAYLLVLGFTNLIPYRIETVFF